MTTDAKIGLLLALVFIVAITFVINGLPDFLNQKDKNELTGSYISHYSKPDEPGIVDRTSREAAAVLNKKIVSIPTAEPVAEANTAPTTSATNYQTILPAASEVVKSSMPETAAPQQTSAVSAPVATTSIVKEIPSEPVAKAGEKIYEVVDGDSLVSIAQKLYGPKAGKKYANIQKIYESNKSTMKSMNELHVGQKLVIPALDEKEQALVGSGLFEKVETPKKATTAKKTEAVKSPETAASKESKSLKDYVVKENDTLWKIAAKQLGDGNRFKEIADLNKTANPDNLVVGTKLKLPAK